MKKIAIFLTAVFVIVLPSLCIYSQEKNIILSTGDIPGNYEVIGIAYGRISTDEIKELNSELERRADKMGADAVINVRYLPYVGYLYAYGTAVKFKK